MISKQSSKNTTKNRLRDLVRNVLLLSILVCILCSGCAPSYPKEKLTESLIRICEKEYNISVQSKLVGKTIVVFLPLDELFDTKLEILPGAIEKIENVILSTSRVLFSTDADVDFYMIIAADVKTTAAELVLVRYMDDVYKFMNGWIKRGEYRQRVLWQINFDPEILKDSFFDFDIQELKLPDFLAEQIAQRLNQIFASTVVHKVKVKGQYDYQAKRFFFSAVVADNKRYKKIYTPIIVKIADTVLEDYNFEDFNGIVVKNELLRDFIVIDRKKRLEYRKVNVGELLKLPFFNL